MNEIYIWIKNIVIYMILNTIIMNLLGNKSYKKYVSIVSGMILVLVVISPLMKFMNLEDKLDLFLKSNDFAIETSDFKNDLNRMEEEQSKIIFAEYEKKIELQVDELLASENIVLEGFEVRINKDPNSTEFGEIMSMDISAVEGEKKQEYEGRIPLIEKVEIARISLNEEKEEVIKKVPSPMEINLKNKLSDFYNIEQGNINISIQGG
ncbi:stage III sporulation protein AF [Lachnospiraceae bacterium MD1]|jgi:stage III sporulation protein AF|uniref:Stage III sporulation protein AF n=1 Tax=Variimorphobacter saccharofermentans TaxID=2755051 RepID=A0A839JYB2_9FIRM|nr:stage III sporulation protein AF [Variimorphobacter saccharofermentans]MBB2182386.1 stage III sporulation protein AF [Variimorphobacter saccharofermentans]